MSWRRLRDVFHLHLQKTSWRCLEDVLIKTNMFALVIRLQKTSQDVFKTSWSRQIYLAWPYVFRRLQDVLKISSRRPAKASSRHIQDVLPRPIQDVFKTSSRRLQNRLQYIFKMSSRPLQDIFKTSCKDAFKMIWRRIIRLNCLSSSRIYPGHISEKFMVRVENLQVWYILA